jgi:P63C domain
MELSPQEKKAAQAFARLGGMKGGKARAEALTPEERIEIARSAATARWAKRKDRRSSASTAHLPNADYKGVLEIGGLEIPCFVLDDHRRVISGRGMTTAIGMKGRGQGIARIASHRILESKENNSLRMAIENPIKFTGGSPMIGVPSDGFEATVLQDLCEAILRARDAEVLKTEQEKRYAKCADILIRAFARVGIIALVDEATGYQSVRPQDALEAYLALIIRKELAAWVKKFPDEFYINIYKLKGWVWPGMQKNRYSIVAHYTRDLVYERLAPGLLEELERKSPKNEKGHRKNKLHDWLTDDVGNPLLAQHLHTLMKFQELSIKNGYGWSKYVKMVDQVMPKRGANLELPLLDQTSELG